MLSTSGAISLAGSTASRSIALEIGATATGQIDINNINVRRIPNLTTANSTISFSNFYSRVAFRLGAANTYLWNVHAASGNGQIIYLVNGNFELYKSTNYGYTATYLSTLSNCYSIDCSSDGTIVVYTSYTNGVYVSTNSGASFTLRLSSALGFDTCNCSSSGALMIASAQNATTASQLYVSTNSGTNWTARGPSLIKWYSVCCSSTSTYMYARNYGTSYIYRSTDSGTNWTTIRTRATDGFVACSANGSVVWCIDNYDTGTRGIAKSTDYGVNWSVVGPYRTKYTPVRCSDDGNKIFVSDMAATWNGGTTWQEYGFLDSGANIQGSVTRDGSKAFMPYPGTVDAGTELGIAYLT